MKTDSPKKNKGFIKVFREIQDSSLWNARVDFFGAAIKLIFLANYTDKRWYSHKLKREIPIKRGELITTVRSLAEKVGLSAQSTRTFLNFLEKAGFILREPTQDFTKITIVNYDSYQRSPTQAPTRDQHKPNTDSTLTKDKKIRERKGNNTGKSKYSSISQIGENEIREVAGQYGVPIAFVNYQLESLVNYCDSKGKKYKNYMAALRNFVLRGLENLNRKSQQQDNKRAIDARGI